MSSESFNMDNWQKNVGLFLTSQAITLIGSSLVGFAIMWYVTLETQSGLMMGVFTLATMLPMFLISPFGGAWADRFNRKYLINIADATIALVTIIIAIFFSLGIHSLELLFVCAIVRSFGQGVQMPTVSALIAQITPQDQLMRVNGINSTIQSISQLGAPALAGVLLSIAPIEIVLYLDFITALIGISVLFFLVKTPIKTMAEKAEIEKNSYLSDIKEGLKYINEHVFLKRFFILQTFFHFLLTPAMMLTPLQVARNFGADVWRLSAIEVAFSGGMVLGGIFISIWLGFKNKVRTMLLGIFFLGVITFGIGIVNVFFIYLILMILVGLSVPLSNTPSMTIFQTKIDNKYLGRVMSIMMMIASLAIPLAMLIFGPLADLISINYIMIITGIGVIILTIIAFFDKILYQAGEDD